MIEELKRKIEELKREIEELKRKFRNIIKQGLITLLNDDTSAYPTAQATMNGKPTDYTRLSPYGLDSNPPSNAWVLLFNSQGDESVKFGIASDLLNRKKALKKGEVVLYNTLSKSWVHLKENGDIELDVKNDLIANVVGDMKATVGGDVTETVGGNVVSTITGNQTTTAANIEATASGTLKATSTGTMTLTAPLIVLSGAIQFDGSISGSAGATIESTVDFHTTKTVTADTEVTAGGKNLKAHDHNINSGSSQPGPTGVNN